MASATMTLVWHRSRWATPITGEVERVLITDRTIRVFNEHWDGIVTKPYMDIHGLEGEPPSNDHILEHGDDQVYVVIHDDGADDWKCLFS
jgi:hypothetical protein